MTAQPFEIRIARLEGALEQLPERMNDLRSEVNARFGQVDRRLDHIDAKIDAKIDVLDAKMDRYFRWTLSTMVALVAVLIAALGAFLHFVH